jgi:hypothetical protein
MSCERSSATQCRRTKQDITPMQHLIHQADQVAADQRANLDTTIAQLQVALTTAKFAGSPHLPGLIGDAIAAAMADARLRDKRASA